MTWPKKVFFTTTLHLNINIVSFLVDFTVYDHFFSNPLLMLSLIFSHIFLYFSVLFLPSFSSFSLPPFIFIHLFIINPTNMGTEPKQKPEGPEVSTNFFLFFLFLSFSFLDTQ